MAKDYRISVLLLVLLGCSFCCAQTGPSQEMTFSSWGVCITPPTGLTAVDEGGMGKVARWAKLDRSGKIAGLIILEVEPANGRTLEDWTATASKGFGSEIRTEPATLGGIRGLHLINTSKSLLLHPDEAYVCLRSGYFWVVSSFVSPQWSDRPLVDQVRKSVRLIEVAAPSQCLEFYSASKPIFGDVRVNVPRIMRAITTSDPSNKIQLGIWNYAAGRDEFSVIFDLLPVTIVPSEDANVRNWAKVMSSKYGQQTLQQFKRLSPARVILDPIKLTKTNPAGADLWMIHGIVELSKTRSIMVTAAVNGSEGVDQAAYQKCFEKIIASIE